MPGPLKIIIIEDSQDDAELLAYALRSYGYELDSVRVDNAADLNNVLNERDWDFVTSDHSMPGFSAPEALKIVQDARPGLPVIIVSGEMSIDLAVMLMKAGALDYVQKSDLARLPLVLEREINEARLVREFSRVSSKLAEAEAWREGILAVLPEGLLVIDQNGMIRFASDIMLQMAGMEPGASWEGMNLASFIPADEKEAMGHRLYEIIAARQTLRSEYTLLSLTGARIDIETNSTPIEDVNTHSIACLSIVRDISERKRAEQELRESEASFRGLFNSVSEAIYIQDQYGVFLDVNDGAVEMYGYEKAFFIGKTPEIISAPGLNDMEVVGDAVARAFRGEKPGFEYWGRRKNGEIFPKDVRLYPGKYFGQNVVIAMAQDITERKKNEQAFRDSERKYKQIFESYIDIYYQVDTGGCITVISPSVQTLTGWQVEELIGTPVVDIYSRPADRQQMMDLLENDGIIDNMPAELKKKDGSAMQAEIHARYLRDDNNQISGIVGTVRDITRRQNAEEALRRSEARYRYLTDKINDIVWTVDLAFHTTYCSPSVQKCLGFTPEERLNQDISEMLTPDSFAAVQEMFAREMAIEAEGTADPDRITTFDLHYYHKNGSSRKLENVISCMRDEHNQLVGFFGVSRVLVGER